MPVTFATATHTGLVRHGNEDSLVAEPPVFAVADGMGGALAGEVASGIAVAALAGYRPGESEHRQELAALVARANNEIFLQADKDTGRSGMGTTLTAAVLAEGAVDFVHVGDSRAYRLRGGSLEQLTQDHSLVGEMVRRGELSEEEALVHPQRSIITRALGVEPEVESDAFRVELEPGDLFLLCSDGLYSMVSPDDIAAIIADSDDLNTAAAGLVEAANAAGGADNTTVVIFTPDGSVPAGSPVVESGADAVADPGSPSSSDDSKGAPSGTGSGAALAATPQKPWWRGWKALLAAGGIIVVLLFAGTWYMTQQIFYLGENEGRVSIYQGLPVDLGPISLSTLYRQSEVLLEDLEPFEQDRVLQHEPGSLETAEATLENYSDEAQRKTEAEERRGVMNTRTTATGVET